MANSYKPGKWSGTLHADVVGDATKTTETLGENYDTELENLEYARTKIKGILDKMKKQVTALKNHSDTGKMATSYLASTEKRIGKIEDSLDSEVKTLINGVKKAAKEEDRRFKQILLEWYNSQNNGNGS